MSGSPSVHPEAFEIDPKYDVAARFAATNAATKETLQSLVQQVPQLLAAADPSANDEGSDEIDADRVTQMQGKIRRVIDEAPENHGSKVPKNNLCPRDRYNSEGRWIPDGSAPDFDVIKSEIEVEIAKAQLSSNARTLKVLQDLRDRIDSLRMGHYSKATLQEKMLCLTRKCFSCGKDGFYTGDLIDILLRVPGHNDKVLREICFECFSEGYPKDDGQSVSRSEFRALRASVRNENMGLVSNTLAEAKEEHSNLLWTFYSTNRKRLKTCLYLPFKRKGESVQSTKPKML